LDVKWVHCDKELSIEKKKYIVYIKFVLSIKHISEAWRISWVSSKWLILTMSLAKFKSKISLDWHNYFRLFPRSVFLKSFRGTVIAIYIIGWALSIEELHANTEKETSVPTFSVDVLIN